MYNNIIIAYDNNNCSNVFENLATLYIINYFFVRYIRF